MTRLVRPATAADLPAIAALGHAAVDLGEYPDATHGDVERNLAALAAEPETGFVAVEDGLVVGCLVAQQNDLYVGGPHRRRGHGTALVAAALPCARAVLGFPNPLLSVPPGDTPGRRFAEARGFSYRASLYWMERPADDPCPPPELPASVVARAFDPTRDDLAAFVALLNGTFADHPTPISWSEAVIGSAHRAPGFDPADILLVAPADDPDHPIAFGRTRLYLGDEPPYGEVKLIGVLPSWRGRGLGRAILRWGVRRLAGRGSPTTALAVSAANEHALRLYEEHGFRRVTIWPQWSREP